MHSIKELPFKLRINDLKRYSLVKDKSEVGFKEFFLISVASMEIFGVHFLYNYSDELFNNHLEKAEIYIKK